MKRTMNRVLFAVATGAVVLSSGGCGGGWGNWVRFLGDALGDALWLRGID